MRKIEFTVQEAHELEVTLQSISDVIAMVGEESDQEIRESLLDIRGMVGDSYGIIKGANILQESGREGYV